MRILAVLAAAGALLAQPPPSTTYSSRLEQELARVRRDIARSAPDDQRSALEPRMARAEAALTAGRMELALYELEPAWEAADTSRFVADTGKVATVDDFAALWKRSEIALTPRDTSRTPSGHAAALVEAFAATAAGRAPATYRASLPFAQDAGLDAGVYYLGDAYADLHFAAFARSLGWPSSGTRPAFRSIAAEIDAFDRLVTSAYEHMDPAQHPSYIRISAAIKQARALDDARQYPAALLQYLLARYRFGLLHPPATAETAPLQSAQHGLAEGADNSIAQLFLQMAAAAEASTDPDTRGSAAVVAADVLPAYVSAVSAPVTTASEPAAAQVTITLVRWPFT